MLLTSHDPYEFTHTVNGAYFRQGITRSSVITYSIIERDDEIIGLVIYVGAIIIDPKTGKNRSATYTLEKEEANNFRDWYLNG